MNYIVFNIIYQVYDGQFKNLDKYEEDCFWIFYSLMRNFNIRAIFVDCIEGTY